MRSKIAIVTVLAAHLVLFAYAAEACGQGAPPSPITYPIVSEDACPLEAIEPVAADGYRGRGFLRKPPGKGPFPAVVWVHGGLTPWEVERLKETARLGQTSRFLAAGYVVLVIDFRSREQDPQSPVSLHDVRSAVDYLKARPYVDNKSVVVYGCSGGGDLALSFTTAYRDVPAVVAEEPASFIFAGVFHKDFPRSDEQLRSSDAEPIGHDPKRYYTAEYQKLTREKIKKIRTPILIVQGDQNIRTYGFNNQILIPELRAARRNLEVITYPGQPHCFAFHGSGPRTPDPAPALKAFDDANLFFQKYLRTKPKPLDPALVRRIEARPGR